jgi:cyclopropane fatty-acyl-phospholipid synthase-like methyltransferase
MLREHLDESHSAASRRSQERTRIVEWIWEHVGLQEGEHLLDLTCGPGLYSLEFADRGLNVTGVDVAPAAIEHARALAHELRLEDRSSFVEADVRAANLGRSSFDAAMVLYGQITVFRPEETRGIVERIAAAVGPGGVAVFEVLDGARVDRSYRTSWNAVVQGLWGEAPYVALTEHYFDERCQASVQRVHVIHAETGGLEVYSVVDYTYDENAMRALLAEAGFTTVDAFPGWGGMPLPDAERWITYVARAGAG